MFLPLTWKADHSQGPLSKLLFNWPGLGHVAPPPHATPQPRVKSWTLTLQHGKPLYWGRKRGSNRGWIYKQLYIAVWVLGLEPRSLEEQFLVITQNLQPWRC